MDPEKLVSLSEELSMPLEEFLNWFEKELSYDKAELTEDREVLRESRSFEHAKDVARELQAREERLTKTEDSVRELRLQLLQQQSRMLASDELGKVGVVEADENDAGLTKRLTVGLNNFHVSRCDVVNQAGLDNLKSELDRCSDVDGCWGNFENVQYKDREFASVTVYNTCRENVIKANGLNKVSLDEDLRKASTAKIVSKMTFKADCHQVLYHEW